LSEIAPAALSSVDVLAVNREICKPHMSEKAPPDVPPYCAVFP
jgi:hypothetical protein